MSTVEFTDHCKWWRGESATGGTVYAPVADFSKRDFAHLCLGWARGFVATTYDHEFAEHPYDISTTTGYGVRRNNRWEVYPTYAEAAARRTMLADGFDDMPSANTPAGLFGVIRRAVFTP